MNFRRIFTEREVMRILAQQVLIEHEVTDITDGMVTIRLRIKADKLDSVEIIVEPQP